MADVHSGIDLVQVVILLASAVVAVPLFKRLGLEPVLGYLAAGLVIGPYGFGVFTDSQAILHVAELGIVMFLFVVGLEMKPHHLWSLRGQIFGLGSLQILGAMAAITLVGIIAGFEWKIALVGGMGFVMTSTAIVMQTLRDRNEIASLNGQKMVSIALFEDLILVPFLAVITFLSPTVSESGSLLQEIGSAGLALAVLVAVGLWLLNPLFEILAKSKAREVMTAAALLVVLGASVLMEKGGLSMAMGAFIAGVVLSESSFRHQLEADIEPFRGLLLGLFFLAVGMALNVRIVVDHWDFILTGVVVLMLTKAVVIYLVARLTGTHHRAAIDRMVLMAQGGEFAFVLYSAAVQSHIIDETLSAELTAMVVISIMITPLNLMVLKQFERKKTVSLEEVDDILDNEETLHGNVLIIGMGRVGQLASQAPIAFGADISIIDNNPDVIRSIESYSNFKVHYGDGTRMDVLHAAGIENVAVVIVAIGDREASKKIVANVKHFYPHVKVFAEAYDRRDALTMINSQADFVVRATFEAALLLGEETVKALGADHEQATDLTAQVRRDDKERFDLEMSGDNFAGSALLRGNKKDDQQF